MKKPVLIVKLGTAVITGKDDFISKEVISKVAAGIAMLREEYDVILVSSGAVGSGKKFITNYKGTLTQRKAAAAIGNPILIQLYQKYFSKYNITVAQALCERHHFGNRPQFLQLKETFETFSKNGILPVVNENDLVSNIEIKFSDNDELATLLAVAFDAKKLIIATSAGGFLNADKKAIPVIEKIDDKVLSLISPEKSSTGLGGMRSKIAFTKLATSLGIEVIISGLQGKMPLQNALAGKQGSIFKPKNVNLKARQKWLASGCITLGRIWIDAGAAKALQQRRSLLQVGIVKTFGNFSEGEFVQLFDEEDHLLAVAKVKHSSDFLNNNSPLKNVVTAHADDIVVL